MDGEIVSLACYQFYNEECVLRGKGEIRFFVLFSPLSLSRFLSFSRARARHFMWNESRHARPSSHQRFRKIRLLVRALTCPSVLYFICIDWMSVCAISVIVFHSRKTKKKNSNTRATPLKQQLSEFIQFNHFYLFIFIFVRLIRTMQNQGRYMRARDTYRLTTHTVVLLLQTATKQCVLVSTLSYKTMRSQCTAKKKTERFKHTAHNRDVVVIADTGESSRNNFFFSLSRCNAKSQKRHIDELRTRAR